MLTDKQIAADLEELKRDLDDLDTDISHLEWKLDDLRFARKKLAIEIAAHDMVIEDNRIDSMAEDEREAEHALLRQEALLTQRYGMSYPAVSIRDWWTQ